MRPGAGGDLHAGRAEPAVGDLDLGHGEAEPLLRREVGQQVPGRADVADGAAPGAHQVLVGVVGALEQNLKR